MKIDVINIKEKSKWVKEHSLYGKTFLTSYTNACFLKESETDVELLKFWKEKSETCIIPMVKKTTHFGENHCSIPIGWYLNSSWCTEEDIEEAVSMYAINRGIYTSYICLHPLSNISKSEDFKTMQYYLNIKNQEADKLYLNFSKTIKNKIKLAEKYYWTNETPLGLDMFYDLYLKQYKNISNKNYIFSKESFKSLFFAEDTLVVASGLFDSNVPLSFSIFGLKNTIAEYLFSVSDADHRNLSAANLYFAIKKLIELKYEYINLGGGVTPGDGIEKFKSRFGSIGVPKSSLKLVLNEDKYNDLCSKFKHLNSKLFPKYL